MKIVNLIGVNVFLYNYNSVYNYGIFVENVNNCYFLSENSTDNTLKILAKTDNLKKYNYED